MIETVALYYLVGVVGFSIGMTIVSGLKDAVLNSWRWPYFFCLGVGEMYKHLTTRTSGGVMKHKERMKYDA